MNFFRIICNKISTFLLLVIGALIPLNGWSNNSPIPSKKLNDVLVAAKAFNKSDCKKYLDRNVLSKGYQPVQIIIKNNSDKNLLFSPDRVSFPCARTEDVAERVHTSTVGRATGYGAGAVLLWPLAIPAIVDGVKSANANEALDSDYFAKTAKRQLLPPNSKLNGLLFVPLGSYQSTFTVTLIDQDTNESYKIIVTAC